MANLVLGACLPNKKYLIVLCICLYVAMKGGHFVFLTHCCMILMDTSTHLCDHFASSTLNSEMCVIWHIGFSTPYLCVQDAHSIEQPVGEHEQERQHGQQGSENEDARHGGLGRPEKQRPHGQQQNKQLERYGDEEALTRRAARTQPLGPEQSRQDEEREWRQEHQQTQDNRERDD